jgi:hypothetical protein
VEPVALLAAGHPVTIFDSLVRPGTEQNLQWLLQLYPEKLSFIMADVRDADAVAAVPFYGYDPASTLGPDASPPKSFDVMHVGHNWWRGRELSRLLPALERIRDELDGVCFSARGGTVLRRARANSASRRRSRLTVIRSADFGSRYVPRCRSPT